MLPMSGERMRGGGAHQAPVDAIEAGVAVAAAAGATAARSVTHSGAPRTHPESGGTQVGTTGLVAALALGPRRRMPASGGAAAAGMTATRPGKAPAAIGALAPGLALAHGLRIGLTGAGMALRREGRVPSGAGAGWAPRWGDLAQRHCPCCGVSGGRGAA